MKTIWLWASCAIFGALTYVMYLMASQRPFCLQSTVKFSWNLVVRIFQFNPPFILFFPFLALFALFFILGIVALLIKLVQYLRIKLG